MAKRGGGGDAGYVCGYVRMSSKGIESTLDDGELHGFDQVGLGGDPAMHTYRRRKHQLSSIAGQNWQIQPILLTYCFM